MERDGPLDHRNGQASVMSQVPNVATTIDSGSPSLQ
jgi:hypothetical protein